MGFMDISLFVYIWKMRSAAGSPSVTEKLCEAFAFDVCPTTQHDLLLWAVGLLVVWWQTAFLCSPLVHHIQIAARCEFLLFLFHLLRQ